MKDYFKGPETKKVLQFKEEAPITVFYNLAPGKSLSDLLIAFAQDAKSGLFKPLADKHPDSVIHVQMSNVEMKDADTVEEFVFTEECMRSAACLDLRLQSKVRLAEMRDFKILSDLVKSYGCKVTKMFLTSHYQPKRSKSGFSFSALGSEDFQRLSYGREGDAYEKLKEVLSPIFPFPK